MKTLVTGAAGFIGSTLAERLLDDGHHVVGIDHISDSYDAALKQLNLRALLQFPKFHHTTADLRSVNICELLRDVDIVFHLAAVPGVRANALDGDVPIDR